MNKVKELLEKMDAEILEKTNSIVMERDAEIKEKAQLAYDEAVQDEIASIKEGVEAQYSTAREYLNELLVDEEVEEEKPEEAVVAEESLVAEEAQDEQVVAEADNEPKVL